MEYLKQKRKEKGLVNKTAIAEFIDDSDLNKNIATRATKA